MNKQKIKKCTVCIQLDKDKIFEKYINNRLKLNISLKEILKEFESKKNLNIPTEYYLKQHKLNCLKDFIVENTIETVINKENIKKNNIDYDKFDKLSSIKKDEEYLKLYHRLHYKLLLESLDDDKIRKENISSLKILNDLININNIDISNLLIDTDNIKTQFDIEKIGLNLIFSILSKPIVSENTAVNIAKLFLKDGSSIDSLKSSFNTLEETSEQKEEKKKLAESFIDFEKYEKKKD